MRMRTLLSLAFGLTAFASTVLAAQKTRHTFQRLRLTPEFWAEGPRW
jgi:hypothetical protein